MTESELLILLGGIKRGELEKRVMNHDFNDHFLAMRGCKQHHVFHAEGDVLTHTDMVVNEAKELVSTVPVKWSSIYLLAALCHDIGKPIVTVFNEKKGYYTAHDHGPKGVQPAEAYLRSIGSDERTVQAVMVLVNRHLEPFAFIRDNTKAKGYRRLRKHLASVDMPVVILTQLARADHFGRICEDGVDTEGTIFEFLKAYLAYEEEDRRRGL